MNKSKVYIAVSSICLIFSVTLLGFGQVQKDSNKMKNSAVQQNRQRCLVNPDSLYNRQNVLEQFAAILNSSIPEFKKFHEVEFSAQNETGKLFFIYDLTDTSNKEVRSSDCVDFKNNHVYHFAPQDSRFSLSHIAILEDGKLKVFKSINCEFRGDKLEDVINYLSERLKDVKNKNEILERVRNYRSFGKYFFYDMPRIGC